MSSDARQLALGQIAALMADHGLTLDDIARHTGAPDKSPKRQGQILKQLLGYTGGIFIFSGICLLIGMIWEDIGPAQRVIITLGSGLVAYVLGFIAVRDVRFDRAATPLFLIAALLEPIGLFVYLDEFYPYKGNPELAAMIVFGAMAVQMGMTFYRLRRSSLLFLLLVFWHFFLGTAMGWLDFDEEFAGLIIGISLLCLSYAADKTPHRAITPFWYFMGAACLLVSFWSLVEGSALDLTYLGLNSFLVYVSIRVASRTLLFVSVIGFLSYLGYFTAEYFADVIGWPIALIVMGMAMIGVSAYALKLSRQIRA